jgi:four helix bundle protein
MVVSRYQDLIAWQLANDLKNQVYALIDGSAGRGDREFCDQIKASASSAAANLAEGFAYYEHGHFAQYARIARAALIETENHLRDGVDRRYWSPSVGQAQQHLANRAIGATTALLRYLTTTRAPVIWPRRARE